jgi:hypothetical protein
MYPWTHFLFPFFIAEVLVSLSYLNHWHALIAGVVGVLIDLDHPIEFVLVRKKFNFRKAWNNSVVSHKVDGRSFIHHWSGILVVILICLVLLYFIPLLALILALGYFSHIFLDYVHLNFLKRKIKFKEFGFAFRIPEYELLFDFVLLILVIFLLIF